MTEENNTMELGAIESYGLTINGEEFNTNINLQHLIDSGKCAIINGNNINEIPNLPGNYWILTNEPIKHSFNPHHTNRPAPIIGESPTLPCSLYAQPLVVQAPEMSPSLSIANMPMVSWFS